MHVPACVNDEQWHCAGSVCLTQTHTSTHVCVHWYCMQMHNWGISHSATHMDVRIQRGLGLTRKAIHITTHAGWWMAKEREMLLDDITELQNMTAHTQKYWKTVLLSFTVFFCCCQIVLVPPGIHGFLSVFISSPSCTVTHMEHAIRWSNNCAIEEEFGQTAC